MDLSFSGLFTAATEATKKHDLNDVCYSLQEGGLCHAGEGHGAGHGPCGEEGGHAGRRRGGQQAAGGDAGHHVPGEGARFFLPARKFMGDNGSMISPIPA